MNVNFDLYNIFYVVAKNGSISSAADVLFISQPAVTFQIKKLEEQLGVSLFTRTKHGVVLTDEGNILFNYVKNGIESIINGENTLSNLKNLDSGILRIGASTTVSRHVLMPYLEKFHEKYPKIDIQIVTNLSSELIPKLKNGLIDIIILNIVDEVIDKDINIVECRKIQDCFVVNSTYKDLINKELSFSDLNDYPLILQSKGSNTRKFLDDLVIKHNVVLKPIMELASYSLVVEFSKIGLGIGYVTKDYIKKELDNKELFILNIKENIPKRSVGIATSKTHLPSFSAKKLIEIITNK